MNMNEILTYVLEPDETASEDLNQQILRKYRKLNMVRKIKKTKPFPKLATTICALVLFCSVTTVAAIKYFTPIEVANDFEDYALAEAFDSESAIVINETQTFDEYCVTLLGIVTGEDISNAIHYSNSAAFAVSPGHSYIVTAIEKKDGTLISEFTNLEFLVSPYIKGENPALINAYSLNSDATCGVINGILYQITVCDNIEIFANRGVYLGITSSTFYDTNAYIWDETDGSLTQNPDYTGVNALFTLPFDESKANPEKATEYLDTILSELDGETFEDNSDTEAQDDSTIYIGDAMDVESIDSHYKSLGFESEEELIRVHKMSPSDPEFEKYYILVENSVEILTPDADNMIQYSIKRADDAEVSSYNSVRELFPNNKPGLSEHRDISSFDGIEWYVATYELMEDGTITARTYELK